MQAFRKLPKLKEGDSVAILSPSFAAPGAWPHVYQLGLERLKSIFKLNPVIFPSTEDLNASTKDKGRDLIEAFERKDIKGIITSLGGDIQVTYAGKLPKEPFASNPKPYFGYSDNSHFMNHLWLCGIPSYYGGALFTEFAMQVEMDPFTIQYLKSAMFEEEVRELGFSPVYNDIGLEWSDVKLLNTRRRYQPNEGWYWNGDGKAEGITWGGCLESVDEMLRNGTPIPSLSDFEDIVLILETSEEIPSHDYVFRFIRALGEREILKRVKGILVGRPKAWEFERQKTDEEKVEYKTKQREIIVEYVRRYNPTVPIVQNMDFGHTAPQICMPYGRRVVIDGASKKITVEF